MPNSLSSGHETSSVVELTAIEASTRDWVWRHNPPRIPSAPVHDRQSSSTSTVQNAKKIDGTTLVLIRLLTVPSTLVSRMRRFWSTEQACEEAKLGPSKAQRPRSETLPPHSPWGRSPTTRSVRSWICSPGTSLPHSRPALRKAALTHSSGVHLFLSGHLTTHSSACQEGLTGRFRCPRAPHTGKIVAANGEGPRLRYRTNPGQEDLVAKPTIDFMHSGVTAKPEILVPLGTPCRSVIDFPLLDR